MEVVYNHDGGVVYGEVTFVCTANILTTYSFRVLWHSLILSKTLIDEYISSFIISRGTLIDLLMILIIPVGSAFSYLSNYHAKDFMEDMTRKLSVTYEMNNISRITKYYDQLPDSNHSKAVNILIYSTTFLTAPTFPYVPTFPYQDASFITILITITPSSARNSSYASRYLL